MIELYVKAAVRRFRIIMLLLVLAGGVGMFLAESLGLRIVIGVVFGFLTMTTLSYYTDDAVHLRAFLAAGEDARMRLRR